MAKYPLPPLPPGHVVGVEAQQEYERAAAWFDPEAAASQRRFQLRRAELENELLELWQRWLLSQPLAPPPEGADLAERDHVRAVFIAHYQTTMPKDAWALRYSLNPLVKTLTRYGADLPADPNWEPPHKMVK